MRRPALRLTVAASAATLACTVQAANWDESLQGEASGDRSAPTPLLFDAAGMAANGESGHNVVSGRIGRDASGVIDRDYFRFVVPEGFALGEIRVGQQTQFGGIGSFIGVAAGATMPAPADATTAEGLLGWRVAGPLDRGSNILDDMAASGNGASGFVGPLGAGEYSVWLQELATGSFVYRYNFVLSPVPEPASITLMGLGIYLLRRAWRRGTQA
jgi:PEP-CTERM motif